VIKKCIDTNCLISCTCNDTKTCNGTETICTKDININNINIYFNSSLTNFLFEGDLNITGSKISFSSFNISSEKNLFVYNSNLIFSSNSCIISQECIYISNTTFTIDLANSTSGNISLLNSKTGCLDVTNYKIIYLNHAQCTLATDSVDSNSLVIVLKQQSSCNEGPESQNPSDYIIIVIIILVSIIGIAIIAILIILIIPGLRKRVFPYRNKRNKRKKEKLEINRYTIQQVEDKVGELRFQGFKSNN